MRILLLGGSKSGKSMMGQHMARRLSAGAPMYYWATLEPRDGEDRAIVRRHLAERDGWGFETIEQGRQLPEALVRVSPAGTVLFDSITACLACQMFSAPEPDGEAPRRGGAAGHQPSPGPLCLRLRRAVAGRRDLRDVDGDIPPGPCGDLPQAGGGI